MDPNVTYALLMNARRSGDAPAIIEHASALREWVSAGGFLPMPMTKRAAALGFLDDSIADAARVQLSRALRDAEQAAQLLLDALGRGAVLPDAFASEHDAITLAKNALSGVKAARADASPRVLADL